MADAPLPFELTLTTQRFGKPLHVVPEVDSTNRLLRGLADDGAGEGTVVLSEYQSAGRGRRARRWDAPPGSSLLVSLLLCPPTADGRLGQLPLLVGVAVAQGLEQGLGLTPTLKWPNDVQVQGKKVAGILVEGSSHPEGSRVIVGIGLNVNQSATQFDGLPDATSLAVVLGQPVARGPLLAALLAALERCYDRWRAGWSPQSEWRRRARLGAPIWVHPLDSKPYPAVALDVAADGALMVRREDGTLARLRAEEVSIRPDGTG